MKQPLSCFLSCFSYSVNSDQSMICKKYIFKDQKREITIEKFRGDGVLWPRPLRPAPASVLFLTGEIHKSLELL